MKLTGWIFAGVMLLFMIYDEMCRPKNVTAISNAKAEALEKKINDTVQYYEYLLKADSSAIEYAVAHAEQASDKALQAEADLQDTRTEVKRLTKKWKEAKGETEQDDKWVAVSPRYVSACDSFPIVLMDQEAKIDGYITTNKVLSTAVKNQKSAYEKKLDDQKAFNSALRKQLDTCILNLKEAGPKRKTQLYGGVNLYGNKTDLVSGGQVALTLLTKKNTMFEVNGLIINGKVYAGVGTKFLISFNRK